jgi:hypothetical protein
MPPDPVSTADLSSRRLTSLLTPSTVDLYLQQSPWYAAPRAAPFRSVCPSAAPTAGNRKSSSTSHPPMPETGIAQNRGQEPPRGLTYRAQRHSPARSAARPVHAEAGDTRRSTECAPLLPSPSCRVDSAPGYSTGRPRYPQQDPPHYHCSSGRGSRLKLRSPSCPSPYRLVLARSPR